jgi:hypothetical protein
MGGGGPLPPPSENTGFRTALLLERFAGVDGDALAYVRAAAILGVRFRPMLAGSFAELDDAQT